MPSKKEVYAVELSDRNTFQSVFPKNQAECSQLHRTVQDAVAYIKSVAGNVDILLPTTCPNCGSTNVTDFGNYYCNNCKETWV